MVMPLDYKDVLLGHRTVGDDYRAALGMLGAASLGIVYEAADKVVRGKATMKNAVKEAARILAEHTGAKLSRRQWLALAGVAVAGAVNSACGGGGGSNPNPPPPPPPPQTYTLQGTVFDLIADNDPNATPAQKQIKLGGIIELLDPTGRRVASSVINVADGSYAMSGIPTGTYTLRITDNRGGLDFVPHEDANIVFTGSQTTITRNEYVIPRGTNTSASQSNRFGLQFDQNIIEPWYREFSQTGEGDPISGVEKWDLTVAQPMSIVFSDDPAQPEPCRTQLEAVYDLVKSDAVRTYTDGRMQDIPRTRGQASDNTFFVELSPIITTATAISDYPSLSGRFRIVRARTRWNQIDVCRVLGSGGVLPAAVYREIARNFGIRAYSNPNVPANTNSDSSHGLLPENWSS